MIGKMSVQRASRCLARRVGGGAAILLALVLAGCGGTAAPTLAPPPAPTDVPVPAPTEPPPLPTATTAALTDKELVERAVAAVEALDPGEPLAAAVELIRHDETRLEVDGKYQLDRVFDLKQADDLLLAPAGGKHAARHTRALDIVEQDRAVGSRSEHHWTAETRLVDGDTYVRADYSGDHPELLTVPEGWIAMRGPASLLPWQGLIAPQPDDVQARLQAGPATALFGWDAGQLRNILTKTLSEAAAEVATLDDGTSVERIRLRLKKDALRVFFSDIDLTNQVNYLAFQMFAGSPVTFTFDLDTGGRLVAWQQDIVAGIENLDGAKYQLSELPAGSLLTATLHKTETGRILPAGTTEAVSAPVADEMAAWPAFTPAVAAPDASFADAGELLEQFDAAATSGDLDAVWQQIEDLEQMPLLFGDLALFLYRGKAEQVSWQGDWRWTVPESSTWLGETDVWMEAVRLPADARLEYQIVVDGQPLVDPLNPLSETGGLGTKSVVAMPGYVWPAFAEPRDGVAAGTVTDDLTIASAKLGYDVNYRVYTPAGYDELEALPTLYVTDGQDFLQFGRMTTILDNLIAGGQIPPIIAVFIDPRDTATGENLREKQFLNNPAYGDFIAGELVPAIEAAYRADPKREARGIVGASYGGYHSAYFALRHADAFALIGALSPTFGYDPALAADLEKAERLPVRMFIGTGTIGDVVDDVRPVRDVLEAKGYDLLYVESPEGHSYATWRNLLDDLLIYLFGEKGN